MLTKIIRITGILIIVLFSALSIVLSTVSRENDFSEQSFFDNYTSFFEDRFYDLRMIPTLDGTKRDNRVVLAEVDDESITKIGRWPWKRTVWVDLHKKLKHYGARVVSYDVAFSEKERYCGEASPDTLFSESIRDFQSVPGNSIIISYTFQPFKDETAFEEIPDHLYNYILDTKQKGGANLSTRYVSKSLYPIPEIADTEVGLASINASPDPDGIFRHYIIASNAQDELYFPSLALLTYQKYTGDSPVLEIYDKGGFKEGELKFKTGTMTVNQQGKTKVRWIGGRAQFPSIAIHELLTKSMDDPEMHQLFKGNIVFVGSTAIAAHDLRHTPVDSAIPGVYFHMNALNMMLDGNFFQPDEKSMTYSWWMLIAGTVLIIVVQLFGNAILDLFTIILISGSLFFIDQKLLLPQGYEIRLFFCMFSAIACYSWTTFINFYLTSKEKTKIRGTFSSFVAPAVVDQMLANPDMVRVGGEKKDITVFFSDVRDFTSISEKLTAEELSTCLNQYMGVMTDILFENKGTLDKYIGDAIVAFWGAPLNVENHAYHAIKASLKMIEVLPEINKRFEEQGFPQFEHGIGLNTGECSVGNMGSDKIFSYTALGDNMNLGARLEALCKFYGVQLNISEYTKDSVPEELQKEFDFRILDKVRVKGKEQAVTIYEVLHATHPFKLDRDALQGYLTAFDLYQSAQFQNAIDLLTPLVEKYPEDKSCTRVKEICENFLQNPPPEDWDGVYTHTTKG